jgi:hypothetical protein
MIRVVRTSILSIRNTVTVTIPVDTIRNSIAITISLMRAAVLIRTRTRNHHACGHENGDSAEQHDDFFHIAS